MAYIQWHVILRAKRKDKALKFVARLEATLEQSLEVRVLEPYWKVEDTFTVMFRTPLPPTGNNPGAIVYEVLCCARRLSESWNLRMPEPGRILVKGIADRTLACAPREQFVEWARFEVFENEEPNDVNEDDR